MAEVLTIISPTVDRAAVCTIVGVKNPGKNWSELSWKDGKAKLSLEVIDSEQHAKEFKQIIEDLGEHFAAVAEGPDLKEINKRLKAAAWILRITAAPDFAATRENSQTISQIAVELDGTCINADSVVDPYTGDAILAWD